MNNYLYTITKNAFDSIDKSEVISALESGKIIYLPEQALALEDHEQPLLSESLIQGRRKNISFSYQANQLSGITPGSPLSSVMHQMMQRYALYAQTLVHQLLPQYQDEIRWGRTSYRPAQIKGRVSSKRKDDTRLHVDAFPSTPVHGLRIFRVFCNINPHGEARAWEVGEPLQQVLNAFSHQLPRYRPIQAKLLHLCRATKTKRSAYDHYMLHLHDQMKLSDTYQQRVKKQAINFPANSTWFVFTDQVSHAALSGQFLLEQTFYLPVSAMLTQDSSPLKQWEKRGFIKSN